MSDKTTTELAGLICTLMPDWQASHLSCFEFLSGGYSNQNYKFAYHSDEFVLRIPGKAGPVNGIQRQAEKTFYRLNSAIKCPEVVYLDSVNGHMISRWIAGELLTTAKVELNVLVQYLNNLHSLLPASTTVYDPVLAAKTFLAVGSAPDYCNKLLNEMTWPYQMHTSPPDLGAGGICLRSCHNDLNPWNLLLCPSAITDWYTLDWELWALNDPLFDFVTLIYGWQSQPPEADILVQADSFIGQGFSEARLRHCVKAYWLREYAFAHFQWYHGNRGDEIAEQLANAGAMLRNC